MDFEGLNELRLSLAWTKPGLKQDVLLVLLRENWVSVDSLWLKVVTEYKRDVQKNEVSRTLTFFKKINAVEYKQLGRYKMYKVSGRFKAHCRRLSNTYFLYKKNFLR